MESIKKEISEELKERYGVNVESVSPVYDINGYFELEIELAKKELTLQKVQRYIVNKQGVDEAKYIESITTGVLLKDSPHSCFLCCKKPTDIVKLQQDIDDLKMKIIEMRNKVQADKSNLFTGLVFVTLEMPKQMVELLS